MMTHMMCVCVWCVYGARVFVFTYMFVCVCVCVRVCVHLYTR